MGFYTVKPGVHGLFNEILKIEKLEPSMAMYAFIPSTPQQRKTGDLCKFQGYLVRSCVFLLCVCLCVHVYVRVHTGWWWWGLGEGREREREMNGFLTGFFLLLCFSLPTMSPVMYIASLVNAPSCTHCTLTLVFLH